MDTAMAVLRGEANRGQEKMVFDWDKAARLIKDESPSECSAGLSGDWHFTGGDIYLNGKPVDDEDTYVYLASTWATPQISIDGVLQDCFKMESETESWGSDTYWPDSALKILESL